MEWFTTFILILAFLVVAWMAYLIGKAVMKQQLYREEQDIRKDAVARSRAVISGQMSEQLAPYFPDFPWNPTEARFIGKPIDFLVFKGAENKHIEEVVFVEVKTGKSRLSSVERSLRDAIKEGKVSWEEYRVPRKQ